MPKFTKTKTQKVIFWSIVFIVAVFLGVTFFPDAEAATFKEEKFCWTPPTERESGDALKPEEIKHYEMWSDYNGDGIKSDRFPDVPAGTNCVTITPIKSNELCVDGYTIDTDNLKSKVSNKVCRIPKLDGGTIPPVISSPPKQLMMIE